MTHSFSPPRASSRSRQLSLPETSANPRQTAEQDATMISVPLEAMEGNALGQQATLQKHQGGARISLEQTIAIRSKVNLWVGKNFPEKRKYISHSNPIQIKDNQFNVTLHLKNGKKTTRLGELYIKNEEISLIRNNFNDVNNTVIETLKLCNEESVHSLQSFIGNDYQFHFENGINAMSKMSDLSVDLLLTDPPYNISKAYICENQVPRRLRNNGGDFIMPKGNFGEWDNNFPSPEEWTNIILPKIRGWAVIFCAQAQIGDYCQIMKKQGFVAISPMVWHKTNPVPFNHKYKPINSWEAIITGKRPGTKFNGHAVHNVFTHKSPSPQDRIHSTQKPEGLLQEFVRLFSNKNEVVVDPFAGSGSTIVAAVTEGRTAIGYENDLPMFDKAKKRISNKLDGLL